MASIGVERFTELVATTLESIREDLQDQVLLRHPTLDLFREKAGSDSGRSLVMNLEAEELDGTAWTDASGTFATTVDKDIITATEWDWSMPLVSKTRLRYRDIEMNDGSKTQVVNRVKAHIEAAKKGHAKTLAKALHAAVPASGAIQSFPTIVATSGQVGGIDPDAGTGEFEYWRAGELVTTRAAQPSIIKTFRTAENNLSDATSADSTLTHIIAGRNIYEEYVDALDDKVRYVNLEGREGGEAQTRFRAVYFGDVEVRYDPDCDADTAYFLDIDTWAMKYLNDNWMKMHEAQKVPGTLDYVTPIASIVALGTFERRANLVYKRTDA